MEWQRKYDKYCTIVAIKKVKAFLENITLDQCHEKFIRGRQEYGGNFEPALIKTGEELLQEAIDFRNYSDIEQYLIWKQDPEAFHEYASQYVL